MTDLGQVREDLLKFLWESEKPVNLKEISEKTGLKIRSANMHLLRLKMAGYVSVSKDGYYAITESGREILGFPKTDQNLAKRVLGTTPPEKAFHFYAGIDQPSGASSDSLIDLCDKIKSVNIDSLEFHTARADFELWVHFLGDIELAKKLRLIRESGLRGERLRERLHEIVRSRSDELAKKVVQ